MRKMCALRTRCLWNAGRIPVFTLFFFLLCAAPAALAAAEAPKNAGVSRPEAVSGRRTQQRAPVQAAAPAQVERDVYAQPPFTGKELVEFTETLPIFLAWARTRKAAHPIMNEAGRPDFFYTPEAAAKVRDLHWEPRRFFCLLGRTAAALYLVEEGSDLTDALPGDMPSVTRDELALVRRHLGALLRASTGGSPPKLAH